MKVRANKRKLKGPVKTKSRKKSGTRKFSEILESLPSSKFRWEVSPMLATLSQLPKDENGWVYEIKWDGYRAMAFMHGGRSELRSRNNKSFNDKFYPVYASLLEWGINAIVDGEIAVLNEKGISDFGALQNWRSEADGELIYYVFDILWYAGKDLTQLPLSERKFILKNIMLKQEMIRFSESFEEPGQKLLGMAKQMGLEGIIAKKSSSKYYPGIRTKEWLKIKTSRRQEMVIGGYTQNEGSSKPFSSLLLGVYENGKLVYTGKVGTGFNVKMQEKLMKQFEKSKTDHFPFTYEPDVNKPSRFRPNPPQASVTWLKPKLVCEVNYAEVTSDGIIRHPSFMGMRNDKNPKDVVWEVQEEAPVKKNELLEPVAKRSRRTLLNPSEESQTRWINGHELKFNRLSKIFWPEENVSKRDLLNYYYQVAPYILPYLKDRPQTLFRHPHGINGEAFYQKDVTGKAPEWIKTYEYYSEADEQLKNYLVCTDEASLMYMISLGCIEVNPWSSTVKRPDHPDWCIIDLDPAQTSFEQVIEAAKVTKDVLDSLEIPAYCKTSGSKGMHIYIPLGAKYTYEQSKEFARVIARMVHEEVPEFTSIERMTKNRKGKMYIDFLQNRLQATVAAPYSLRPKPGATVSMPLHWDEVKKGLKMRDFNIFNAVERVRSKGDIFKPVIGKGIDLEKVVRKFEKLA
jgi:bifunctional non-homologous end joining protein LigD